MPKELKIVPKKDGCDIVEVDKHFSFVEAQETTVASVKASHLLNAIYFAKHDEIDALIMELTDGIRIAKDYCDNQHTVERLTKSSEKAFKFRESVKELIIQVKAASI